MPSFIVKQVTGFVLACVLAATYGAAAADQADKKAVLAVSGMT